MEKLSDVHSIQLQLGQAFSQKIAMRPAPVSETNNSESDDSKYVSFFMEAYRNPAAHDFHFA